MRIMVFDTETSGLPERNSSIYEHDKYPYILQLSYVIYDTSDNRICVIKDDYVKIDNYVKISPMSQEVHGISREKCLAEGKPIQQLLMEFNNYLKSVELVIGHNISFDKKMIFVECGRNNIQQQFTWFRGNRKIQRPEYCTMKNTVEFCAIESLRKRKKEEIESIESIKPKKIHYKYPKLHELHYKLFGIHVNPNMLHNSRVDVLVTLKCYMKYVCNIDIATHPLFRGL